MKPFIFIVTERDGGHTPTGNIGGTSSQRLLQMRADVGLEDPEMRLSEGGTALQQLPVTRAPMYRLCAWR